MITYYFTWYTFIKDELNFVDEYPCKQPLSLKSDFNITLDNATCDKRTFEWYKRNNSDEDVDDGVRYNIGCKMSYECGEGACLTNNTETCLNEDKSPNFTCELSKIIIITAQHFCHAFNEFWSGLISCFIPNKTPLLIVLLLILML